MAIEYGKNLANGVVLPTSAGAVYTAPTTVIRTIINQARLVNVSAFTKNVTMYVLQAGEAVADARKSRVDISISPGETQLLTELIGEAILSTGSVQAFTTTADTVYFSATGTEIS